MRAEGLPRVEALRTLRALRRGSSCPVVVDTSAGQFVTKLRGAAQGPSALAAEIVVAGLATVLGLSVPRLVVVRFSEEVPTDDRNDELAVLLRASAGDNLGVELLQRASDLRGDQLHRIDDDFAARVLWLDGLVLNPDRTLANPNVLLQGGTPWLIDHGAALGFVHGWEIDEDDPRAGYDAGGHLFCHVGARVREVDDDMAGRLGRDALEQAVTRVPDTMLQRSEGWSAERARAAIVAFLWKRLRPPRPFVA